MIATTQSPTAFDVLTTIDTVGTPCTPSTGEECFDIHLLADRIVKLACVMCEKHLYEYQQDFIRRIVVAILEHRGDMITALLSRQSGKTEGIAALVAAVMVMLPELAKEFPTDWRLNITDDFGRYRGFKNGINFGIYAPILEQSGIMFDRIRLTFDNDGSKAIMSELGLTHEVNRGNVVRLSNNSSVLAMSASKNSKIEGHTHHVVIAEEAQDIDSQKIRKSIHPMIASTKGTIVKIGTASTQKGDFYEAIRFNVRNEITTGVKNHFFYPYQVCVKFNSLYGEYIDQEKMRIGETSDEFRMSYACEWLLERGMFVIDTVLMASGCAITQGAFAEEYIDSYAGSNLVVGIDLGKEHDSTVCTVIDVDWANPVIMQLVTRDFKETEFVAYVKHLVAWREFHGDDYEFQYHEICEWLRMFRPLRKIVLDATRESSFADRIRHTPMFSDVDVEDFIFGVQTKAAGYRLFQGDLLSKRFTFPAGAKTRRSRNYMSFVRQMLDLTKSYSGDYLVVSHPDEPGARDDFPDSAMLANWGANEPTADMQIEVFSTNTVMYGAA